MRTALLFVVATTLVIRQPVVAAPGDVRVTLHDGVVSVSAKNATLREILEVWGRVGETAIITTDQAATTPITLDLIDVSEEQALAVLLRSTGGYLAVPRPAGRPDASRFARIVILPASVADRNAAVRSGSADPTSLPQQMQPPVAMINGVARLIGPNGLPIEDDQQDAPPPPVPQGFFRGDAPPPPGVFPPPGAPVPQQPPQRSPSSPTPGIGSSIPGMVAPQQPQGQPPPTPTPQR